MPIDPTTAAPTTAAHAPAAPTMRTVRFHEYGDAADVLRLETVPVPAPGPGRIRVTVHACGLAPADWALCGGLFAGLLPRGIGIDVSGTVDSVGPDVTGVAVGDLVVGTADWRECTTAGASDHAVLNRWVPVPSGLDLTEAAALPMAVDTAYRHLHALGLQPGATLLVSGAGTTIGFAAVQIALVRGLRVVATAGPTHTPALEQLGATVTPYGPGLAERVLDAVGAPVDLVLDTAPVTGVLPELVAAAGGEPQHVMTITDIEHAPALGVRDSLHEDWSERVDALAEFVGLAAQGRFTVPIARTFPLEDWRAALELSRSNQAHGKLLLLPGVA